jgi:tryptophan halogenase
VILEGRFESIETIAQVVNLMPERWLDPGVPELRADACQVQSTRDETFLLFGSQQGAGLPAKLARRIVLPPVLAKQLAAVLNDITRDTEEQANATPAGSMLSSASNEDAPEESRPMLALVRALNVPFGFEKSFKLSHGDLRTDRVIFGVRTRLVDRDSLLKACRVLGMPVPFLEQFEELLPEANTVGFGFEGGAYKIYLEFWDRLRQRVQRDPSNTAPETLFLGYKWAISEPARCAVARYTCYPLLSVRAIHQRLAALYNDVAAPSLQAAQQIVGLASPLIGPNDSFVYVEATEDGNPRKSFDLNLYKAGLKVSQLYPALASLSEHYAIRRDGFDKFSTGIGVRSFGHLSGGIGRDGMDFLTVYYELDAL